jgi:ketosteroid isomerase-like protein
VADERVAWFRETVARWNAGSRDVDWDRIHPEFELHSKMMGGVRTGPDALRSWFEEIDQQFDAWELRVEREERLGPDRFLMMGKVRLRGRGSGLEMEQDIAWLLEFEGKQGRMMKTFTNPDEALAETGLEGER